MNPRSTMKIYPRPDTYYKNKRSLDFDMMRSRIMLTRGNTKTELTLWFSHILCGVLMGFLSFMLTLCEDKLTVWRCEMVQHLITIDGGFLLFSYLWYVFTAVIFVLMAALLTVYVAPAAMGSGVAEVMGLMNGVNYD